MEKYLFKTQTSMKDYNRDKWWISYDYVGQIEIEAISLKDALEKYAQIVEEKHCIGISKNALKTKRPMFIDTKDGRTIQTGYVITGSSIFHDDEARKWTTQYIDLWVEILKFEYAAA